MDKLKIAGKGPTGRNIKVSVNGTELTGLTGLTLYIGGVSDVTTAIIEIDVDEVYVDAETLSELVAIAKKKEPNAETK